MNIIIDVSWPEPCLWPNRRAHWSALSRARVSAKHEAFVLTVDAIGASAVADMQAYYAKTKDPIQLVVVGHKPNDRKRDLDNLSAALKATYDGIARALGVDDERFEPTVRWGEIRKPRGGVTIVVGE